MLTFIFNCNSQTWITNWLTIHEVLLKRLQRDSKKQATHHWENLCCHHLELFPERLQGITRGRLRFSNARHVSINVLSCDFNVKVLQQKFTRTLTNLTKELLSINYHGLEILKILRWKFLFFQFIFGGAENVIFASDIAGYVEGLHQSYPIITAILKARPSAWILNKENFF